MFSRSIARLGVASLLGALAALQAANAEAATGCNPATLLCTQGSAALHGAITTKLPTVIDSGMMDEGSVKVRARFTVDPVDRGPLLSIDMPTGALVQATWSDGEKGTLSLSALTDASARGTMNVHYTLTPSIEASLFGITITRDATQLLEMIPGAKFNYDAQTSTTLVPWGFAGAAATAPAPSLDNSTLFSLPLTEIGLDPSIAEGSLAIQAAAKPTFNYTTKSVQFDAASLTSADGTAKLPVGDVDSLDVNAMIVGEVALSGDLDIRPVVVVDSIDGFPTFGLTKFSFSAVKKSFAGGAPVPVQFTNAQIHIPLPNVKVPTTPLGIGTVKAGKKVEKTVSITNTGELGGLLRITSSDPQFVVPAGEVRVDSKGKYDLKLTFQPTGDGPASATITVKSNDPDSPEQTFKVGANGASLEDEDDSTGGKKRKRSADSGFESSDGCSVSATGTASSSSVLGLGLGLGLAVVLASRRRRR